MIMEHVFECTLFGQPRVVCSTVQCSNVCCSTSFHAFFHTQHISKLNSYHKKKRITNFTQLKVVSLSKLKLVNFIRWAFARLLNKPCETYKFYLIHRFRYPFNRYFTFTKSSVLASFFVRRYSAGGKCTNLLLRQWRRAPHRMLIKHRRTINYLSQSLLQVHRSKTIRAFQNRFTVRVQLFPSVSVCSAIYYVHAAPRKIPIKRGPNCPQNFRPRATARGKKSTEKGRAVNLPCRRPPRIFMPFDFYNKRAREQAI